MTTRIALLGAGAMGTIMGRDIYPRIAAAEVVAVVDHARDRRESLAALLGARPFATLAEAHAAERLDGVDIRLPHGAHADTAVEATELALQVLVEKPLATSLADAERVVAAGRRTGVAVAVAENYPHLRAVRAAAAALSSGRIGELLALRTTRAYTLEGVWAETDWRQGSDATAGILWDQGTHHTSLIRELGGEVVAVAAAAARGRVRGSETVALTLELASGAVAQSLYCWGTPGVPSETEATVWGTRGRLDISVAYDGPSGSATLIDPSGSRPLAPPEDYYDSHRLIVEDWLRSIDDGTAPRVGPLSALDDVRVVLAARRSLDEGGTRIELGGIR